MKFDRRNMPKCWTYVEDWREWNRLAAVSDYRGNYCSDCLPAFKQQMVAEGRCRFPDTHFVVTKQAGHTKIVGVRA